MRARSKSLSALATVALVLTMATTIVACSGRADDLQTVNSSDSLFHVKVPPTWQHRIDDNFMGLYASKELPTSEDLKSLSIVILSGKSVSDTPTAELLAEFARDRSVSRGWKGAKLSKPVKTTIGGRPANKVRVSGNDVNGEFAGAYYLIRTSGADVLVMAVAPADQWVDAEAEVTQLTTDWFWHEPPGTEVSDNP